MQRILINNENNIVTMQSIEKEIRKENLLYAPIKDIPADVGQIGIDNKKDKSFQFFIEEQEKEFIQYHLNIHKTTRKTAESLGMSQSQLMRKKKKYNL